MKLLLDTNVVIAGEPTDILNVEPTTKEAARLIGLIQEHGYDAYIHPASVVEVEGDRDQARRSVRLQLLAKYLHLPAPPEMNQGLIGVLGEPPPGSHNEVDLLMLSAVASDAVDLLITSDTGIHRRAKRVGLQDRVLSLPDAIFLLRGLASREPVEFPAVERILYHQVDHTDEFFDSLRRSYGVDSFNNWIARGKREHRPAYRITVGGRLAALALLKEGDNEPRLREYGKVLKICTFKVADEYRGNRFGELLLKPVFEHCTSGGFAVAFCTCFRAQAVLIEHLRRFGFWVDGRTANDELLLAKRFAPTDQERVTLSPLEYHIRFGPGSIKVDGAEAFVIPVIPAWHSALFPELDNQMALFAGETPFGNSIRKAYLCRSNTRRIVPGSLLLFYRSQDQKSVRAIGVAETSLRSADSSEIARFVGTRTVYSRQQIESMTEGASRQVLAILFRQASSIESLPLDQLVENNVLRSHPQSITRARPEGIEWIRRQIEE